MSDISVDATGEMLVSRTMVAPGEKLSLEFKSPDSSAGVSLYGPSGEALQVAVVASGSDQPPTLAIPENADVGTHTIVVRDNGRIRSVGAIEVLSPKSILKMAKINQAILRANELLERIVANADAGTFGGDSAELFGECATLARNSCEDLAVRILLEAAEALLNAQRFSDASSSTTQALSLLPNESFDDLREAVMAVHDLAVRELDGKAAELDATRLTGEMVAVATSDSLDLATARIQSRLAEFDDRVRSSRPASLDSTEGDADDAVDFSAQKLLADLLKCGVALASAVDIVADVAEALAQGAQDPLTGAAIRDHVVNILERNQRAIGLGWSEWLRAYRLQFGDAVPLMISLRRGVRSPLTFSLLRDKLVPEHVCELLRRPLNEVQPQLSSHDRHHIARQLLTASRGIGLRVVHEDTLLALLRDLASNAQTPWFVTSDVVDSQVQSDLDAAIAASLQSDHSSITRMAKAAMLYCSRAVLSSYRRFLGVDEASTVSRYLSLSSLASETYSDRQVQRLSDSLRRAAVAFCEDMRAVGIRPIDVARLSHRAVKRSSWPQAELQELTAMLSATIQARQSVMASGETEASVDDRGGHSTTLRFVNVLRRQRRMQVEADLGESTAGFFAVHSIQELAAHSLSRRLLFFYVDDRISESAQDVAKRIATTLREHPMGQCNTVVFISDDGFVPRSLRRETIERASLLNTIAIRSDELIGTYSGADRQGELTRVLLSALHSEY